MKLENIRKIVSMGNVEDMQLENVRKIGRMGSLKNVKLEIWNIWKM